MGAFDHSALRCVGISTQTSHGNHPKTENVYTVDVGQLAIAADAQKLHDQNYT